MPEEFRDELGAAVYGCDICQDVCPWNRGSRSGARTSRSPDDAMPVVSLVDWLDADGDELVRQLDRLYVPAQRPSLAAPQRARRARQHRLPRNCSPSVEACGGERRSDAGRRGAVGARADLRSGLNRTEHSTRSRSSRTSCGARSLRSRRSPRRLRRRGRRPRSGGCSSSPSRLSDDIERLLADAECLPRARARRPRRLAVDAADAASSRVLRRRRVEHGWSSTATRRGSGRRSTNLIANGLRHGRRDGVA